MDLKPEYDNKQQYSIFSVSVRIAPKNSKKQSKIQITNQLVLKEIYININKTCE